MRGIAGSIAIVFLLNCNVTQIILPKDENLIDPVKPTFEKCEEDKINPERFRNLKPNQAVLSSSYAKVIKENRDCIKEQGNQNLQNYRSALSRQETQERAFWDGTKWGAIGVLVVEIILVGLYLL